MVGINGESGVDLMLETMAADQAIDPTPEPPAKPGSPISTETLLSQPPGEIHLIDRDGNLAESLREAERAKDVYTVPVPEGAEPTSLESTVPDEIRLTPDGRVIEVHYRSQLEDGAPTDLDELASQTRSESDAK